MPEKKDYKKVMLVIMDAVGFNQEDIDITLGHNFLKLKGAMVTIHRGRKIDEEVYISKEHACDPMKVITELAKRELTYRVSGRGIVSCLNEEESLPVYDTDIEDVIEEEKGFVAKGGFGREEDNIEDVVVVDNVLCSLMI
uniref:Uncharacterized protein n=1 Tax=Tanacetum cinerariifolium TaxID=118510 RepID=A0A699GNF5_TANCI|nr:hypothetical protein [Tanacetum cinerariifolium]